MFAERTFGDNAQQMTESLLYLKLPPDLKQSLNSGYLENGTYNQIVAHHETKTELSGLENDGELTIPTMTAVPPNDNQQTTEQTKMVCQYCKRPGHLIRDSCKRMKKNRSEETIPRSKTRYFRRLNQLHPVLLVNEQIILQKNFGAVLMPLIDPNGSNRIIQQMLEMMAKKEAI